MDNDELLYLGTLGDEKISWKVYDRKNDYALLITEKVIDGTEEVTKDYLEGMYEAIFTEEEKSKIVLMKDTHVFLPDFAVLESKDGDKIYIVYPTEYAKKKNICIYDAEFEANMDAECYEVTQEMYDELYKPYDGSAYYLALEDGTEVLIEVVGHEPKEKSDLRDLNMLYGIRLAMWIKMQ